MIDNDKISNSQLCILIVLTAIGVGIFSLPRVTAEITNTDAWLTTILGGLLALLDFYIISRLAKKFPDATLVGITRKIMGRFLTFFIILIFWVYILSVIAMTLRIFGEVLKMSLLLRTPIEVVLITFLILTLMLIRGGLEPIVRFDEITFPILFFAILISVVMAIPRCDFTNLLPVFTTKSAQLLYGAYKTTYSYAGFEFILLIIPFIKKPDRIFSSGVKAFIIIMFMYTAAVVLSFGKFGVVEMKKLMWPTLSMIRSIDVPFSFVERLEGIIMMQWVLFAFTTIVPFTYGSSIILSELFKHSEFKHFCTLIIPIVYIIALIPDNVVETYKYLDVITTYLGTFSIFILPIFLLIVSSIRKMGVRKNA